MEFLNLTELIQVFANEYISPKDKVLLIKNEIDFTEGRFAPCAFNFIFNFIGCESYYINLYQDPLPFEESFNVIINLTLTPINCKLSLNLNFKNEFYTVINGQTEIFGTIPFTK